MVCLSLLSIDQIIKSWCFILSSIEFTILFLFHCSHFCFLNCFFLYAALSPPYAWFKNKQKDYSSFCSAIHVVVVFCMRDNFFLNFSMFCLCVWCALSCSYLGHFFRRRRYWLRLMLHPPSTQQLSRDSGYFVSCISLNVT